MHYAFTNCYQSIADGDTPVNGRHAAVDDLGDEDTVVAGKNLVVNAAANCEPETY